jgi:hypothetical protein
MNPIIALAIRASGRAWWQARYSDGEVLNEWDTIPGRPLLPIPGPSISRWEEVPKKGMVGLRLLCPNGMAGELEAPEGYRFFQFKVTYFDLILFGGGSRRTQTAHVIGVVKNADGNCFCRAWEIIPQSKLELSQLQTQLAVYKVGNQENKQKEIERLKGLIATKRLLWHLTQFEDNIYSMKYENLGKLNLDVQGLKV